MVTPSQPAVQRTPGSQKRALMPSPEQGKETSLNPVLWAKMFWQESITNPDRELNRLFVRSWKETYWTTTPFHVLWGTPLQQRLERGPHFCVTSNGTNERLFQPWIKHCLSRDAWRTTSLLRADMNPWRKFKPESGKCHFLITSCFRGGRWPWYSRRRSLVDEFGREGGHEVLSHQNSATVHAQPNSRIPRIFPLYIYFTQINLLIEFLNGLCITGRQSQLMVWNK